ncbi:MAG: hypothetical protein OEZ43_15120 [Gammaproteobacteria bacterium]|nr:hypothetical protein [Gammaproteobacteria bacterium]
MRNILAIVVTAIFLLSSANAADKNVAKAMKAFEGKEYNRAISILSPALPNLSGEDKDLANLSLGIVMLKNGELHREFFRSSIDGNIEYLSGLHAAKSKRKSTLAPLYLGEAYLHKGDYRNSIKYFSSGLKTKSLTSEQRDVAESLLGLAFYKSGNKAKANSTWESVKGKSSVVDTTLLAAKHRAGLKVTYDVNSLHQRFVKEDSASTPVSSRHISNLVYLFTEAGDYDKALNVLESSQVDSPSDREISKDDKQISFYDIAILDNISKLMKSASVKHLELASSSPKLGSTANFYLMDSGVIFGDAQRITQASNTLASMQLPKSLAKYTPVKVKAGDYMGGQKTKATDAWKQIISQNSSDPAMLAEVLSMCVYTEADCKSALDSARSVSATGQGRKYTGINAAIGRYLLKHNNAKQALEYLELARDKSNKNKISANDPMLLVDLAEAYRSEKTYSEHLEIYFEMNHHFPVVRQIQEAVQGTYATQQKSAGDVKIF